MSGTAYNRLSVKGFFSSVIIVSVILLASSPVRFNGTPARASAVVSVDIAEFQPTLFDPQNVTINVGDTVCWTSLVGDHTTTSDLDQAEYWNSGDINDGMTFCFTFTVSGNFTYHSSFPEDAGQVGWILVQQSTPEFPGYLVYLAVAAAVMLAILVEKRFRA